MARRKKRSKYARFVRLEKALLESQEWQALSLAARIVLIEFLKSFNGFQPHLRVAYSQAPCNRRTFRRALKELINGQWLELVEPGGLLRRTSVYRLGPKGERWWPEIFHLR
jgi:hypothetical protein